MKPFVIARCHPGHAEYRHSGDAPKGVRSGNASTAPSPAAGSAKKPFRIGLFGASTRGYNLSQWCRKSRRHQRNSPSFSSVDKWSVWPTYQISPNTMINCAGTQGRRQNTIPVKVVISRLKVGVFKVQPRTPRQGRRTGTRWQGGPSSNHQPPYRLLTQISGKRAKDTQNGKAFCQRASVSGDKAEFGFIVSRSRRATLTNHEIMIRSAHCLASFTRYIFMRVIMEHKLGFSKMTAAEFTTWITQQTVPRTIHMLQQHHTWRPKLFAFQRQQPFYPAG